jgi:primosomal replication protein N
MAQCKSCGADIDFVKSKNGNWMPINKDGSSHFQTCPNAKEHRKDNRSNSTQPSKRGGMDFNQVVLTGVLVHDCEFRSTPSGPAASFTLEVNTSQKVGDTWETKPHHFACAIFGRQAESLQGYLVKGKQVGILGNLSQGQTIGIRVHTCKLLGGPPKSQEPEQMDDSNVPF